MANGLEQTDELGKEGLLRDAVGNDTEVLLNKNLPEEAFQNNPKLEVLRWIVIESNSLTYQEMRLLLAFLRGLKR